MKYQHSKQVVGLCVCVERDKVRWGSKGEEWSQGGESATASLRKLQIYWQFYHIKMKIFWLKTLIFFIFLLKT